MNKQEILDAINATIAPNNIKGITAESLNNVLTMMAENAGEGGGGDGALRVIVPDMLQLGPEIVAMGELSPASWEEMKSLLEQSGIDPSEYDAVVKASFEHNANVAQQIIEKGKAGQGISVVLDHTPYFPAAINVLFQLEPEMAEFIEEYAMCGVQPAGLSMRYISSNLENEPDEFVCNLAPTGNIYFDGMDITYPSNMLISLNRDGSLTFTPIEEEQPSSGSGVVTFYTTVDGGELSEEYKAKNADAYSSYKNGMMLTICFIAEGAVQSTVYPMNSGLLGENVFASIWTYIDGNPGTMTFTCTQDGSATIQQ